MDSNSTLPKTYKALFTNRDGNPAYLDDVTLEAPGKNQVVVKMAFAPINLSDLGTVSGSYVGASGKSRVGFEGSGEIVAVGESLLVPHKVGDKVHVLSLGTWGEYLTVASESAFKIISNVSLEEGACHFVNPATVVQMSRAVVDGKHKAAIHTAGSSSLGRMMIRYFKTKGIKLISIVRKQQYVDELIKDGADYVLNSSDENFEKTLAEVAQKEEATIAFDAIAGDMTSKILHAMPNKSVIQVYGALGGRAVNQVSVEDLLFKEKTVKGLWLTSYFGNLDIGEKIKFLHEAHSNLGGDLKSNVQKKFKLSELSEAIAFYKDNSSEGKIVLGGL